jgi:hypothetical protein
MKFQSAPPAFYQWSQAKDAADKLATWAYATLIKPESPHAKTYPLTGVSSRLLQDGSWGLILPQPEEPTQTKELSKSMGFSQQPKEFLEPSRIRQILEEIASALQKTSEFSKCYYSLDFISGDLSNAVDKANRLLAELAATNKWSAERFWFSTLQAVIELENLSARTDAFLAIQSVARKQTMWPVVYPQNKAEQLALKREMERLGLGTQTIHKIGHTNRHSPSGKYARRIGLTLWRIHFDGNLRQCLHRHAVAPLTSKGEIALDASLYKEEAAKGLLDRTPDAESPQKWEARLVAQGWPRWVVRLHQLPELTAANANDWFEVGWEALKEATGGDVTLNRELAALGNSNVEYGRHRATTVRGQTGAQKSRAENQIKTLLQKAFVARFGNEVNFQTKPAAQIP